METLKFSDHLKNNYFQLTSALGIHLLRTSFADENENPLDMPTMILMAIKNSIPYRAINGVSAEKIAAPNNPKLKT